MEEAVMILVVIWLASFSPPLALAAAEPRTDRHSGTKPTQAV